MNQGDAFNLHAPCGFRFEFAGPIGNENQLKFRQRPTPRPVELIERRMAARRIFFAGTNDGAARAGHVDSPRHRFFIDRKVMKKRILARHRRIFPHVWIGEES